MLRSFLFIAAAVFVLPAVISMPFSVLLPTSTRSMFFMFMPNLRTILLSRQSNISAAIWAGLWLLLHVLIITMGNPSHFITTGMNTTNTFRKRFLSSTSYRNWLSIYRKNTLKWPGIMVFMPNIINRNLNFSGPSNQNTGISFCPGINGVYSCFPVSRWIPSGLCLWEDHDTHADPLQQTKRDSGWTLSEGYA